MKQNLKLGKYQRRDFAEQSEGTSLCILQDNIISYVKLSESYETVWGLFAEVTKSSVELLVVERIADRRSHKRYCRGTQLLCHGSD